MFINYGHKKFYKIGPGPNGIKNYGGILQMFLRHGVFVSSRLFQPSLIFVRKSRSLPKSGAPESCFTWVGSPNLYELSCRYSGYLAAF